MGSLSFIFGSAVGAAGAWFLSRRALIPSTLVVFSGVVAGVLGMVILASWRSHTPASEFGLGLLSTVAPLTLCLTPMRLVATSEGIVSTVRAFTARLALALVCGISCAILGFVLLLSLRYVEVKENEGKAVSRLITNSPRPSGLPGLRLPL
jgi:hypothetical protein